MFTARKTRYSRELLAKLSKAYGELKVFKETSRMGRAIVLSQMKGSEMGVVTYTLLPTLAVDMIQSDRDFW